MPPLKEGGLVHETKGMYLCDSDYLIANSHQLSVIGLSNQLSIGQTNTFVCVKSSVKEQNLPIGKSYSDQVELEKKRASRLVVSLILIHLKNLPML